MTSKMAFDYKEILSVLLIVILLVIHTAKLFHSHNLVKSTDWTSQTVKVERADFCLICDYHFTKDAEINFSTIQLIKQPPSIYYPILYTSQTIASIGLHYSDRGPPIVG